MTAPTTQRTPEHKLLAHLRSVWRRDQALHRTAGLLALCRWALVLFLVGMAVDWLVGLPTAGRFVVLALLAGVAFLKAWKLGWQHLRRFDASRTALRVEAAHGGMESLLVTAVQVGETVPGVSAAMSERTRGRAEEAAETMRPEESVSFAGLRRFVVLALVPVSILGGLALFDGPLVQAGLGRIFAPWLAIEYPTRTQIELVDADRIVKEGDGLRLVARLSGEIPDRAHIVLRTGQGEPRRRQLAVADGACEYAAETVFRSFDYRILAGDARSAWHRVRVISSPRIERAEVRLAFPDYTRRPPKTVEALTLTVPEGTKIEWQLTLDRAVRSAELRPVEGEPLPLEVGPDGRSVKLAQVADASRAYSFGWVGRERGFAFESPRHYLQVAPDRPPSVELTSPRGMLYATLQRRLDFAYRGRDDHGIGAAALTWRVNKTAETRVELPAPEASDGGEQRLDWDYRKALPDLAVGDAVAFAVELADRYPGPDGPHRARSDIRRVRFLSKADYLAQIEKQKRRLLARVRAIYREERAVHDLVRHLDPSKDVFLQTCQLEAVRQDLIRERLGAIRDRIGELVEDLAANKVADEAESRALAALGAQLARIGDEHVGRAASLLRALATVDVGTTRDPAPAIDMVHRSARELGLVVLQLGFAEASDVMARELHATAQAQAALRHRTLVGDGGETLAAPQTRLAEETARLLAAIPKNRESTSADALIAFNLSRLVGGLVRSGVDAKMRSAAARAQAEPEAAARTQAEVIAALLHAEFRLRRGALYEALTAARDLFAAQAAAQKGLREASAARTEADFRADRASIARAQAAIQRELRLLLLPEVPAPRPRLFDEVVPEAPPVADLLVRAEGSIEKALARIEAGERAAAAAHQRTAEGALAELLAIVRRRIEIVTQAERLQVTVTAFAKQAVQRLTLEERLLVLLEQTEDAAAAKGKTAALVALNRALAEDARGFLATVRLWSESLESGTEEVRPLLASLERAARAVRAATPLLRESKADAARQHQERALEALEEAGALIEEQTRTLTAFAGALATTRGALMPSPLLVEIEAEQGELSAITKKSEPKDRPALVIPQKNLVHAVNAVLTALDPLAHKIESGTVMLFAKEDMNAAATGLESNDIEEALDAQSFVVESIQGLRAKIDAVTPQYRDVLELVEFLSEVVPKSAVIRAAAGAPAADTWKKEVEQFGRDLQRLTGAPRYAATVGALLAASESATGALAEDTAALQTLMENLTYLITPPPSGAVVEEPSPEVKLIHAALAVAAHHKDLARKTRVAKQVPELAGKQRELAKQAAALLPKAGEGHPQLVAARRHLDAAAKSLGSGDREAVIKDQRKAADALRFFVLEYTLAHVQVPPPPPPQDPAPSDDATPDDGELQLFMPGALTGKRPKGGRLEWQVLGRRDRAALNENFARELPLEYRAILKDYYERLTR